MFDQLGEQQEAIQKELAAAIVESSSGDGLVHVKMSGTRELRSLTINREHPDFVDADMLEDHIILAVNMALTKAAKLEQDTVQNWMSRLLPGGLGSLKGLFGK